MSQETLAEFVQATAEKFGIPGVAVGVLIDGKESYACHGVTSLVNPLPVDEDTMFTLGSVTKTVTATALMRLVAEGKVELAAPVRRYVPELVLADERTAETITVLNLLNHTAGFGLGGIVETGAGDDALARYIAQLPELELIAPPGTRASYSQAGYNLLGRIIEKVTGLTYERAVSSLVFKPLGMSHSCYLPSDLLSKRFTVGHNLDEDGAMSVALLRKRERGDNPGGGLESSVSDLIRFARFHLGDCRADGGEQVLPAEVLDMMKQPTVELRGSALGDSLGLCWFLRDVDGVDGVRSVGHGGSTNGQFAELLLAPERGFAVVALANSGPDGIPFNQAVVRWALENYVGVIDRDPEPVPFDATRASEIVGRYDVDAMTLHIDIDGAGLTIAAMIKPEIRAAAEQELPPDYPAAGMGLLPGSGDEYIISDGGLSGQRGFFTRDAHGAITGVDLAGRLFTRIRAGN